MAHLIYYRLRPQKFILSCTSVRSCYKLYPHCPFYPQRAESNCMGSYMRLVLY